MAAPGRRRRSGASVEQTGLDTLVVHAVNDVDLEVVPLRRGFRANALSRPPGKYSRS